MSGNRDVLINKRNSEKLYDNCPCIRKYLKIFDGDHNSKRPDEVLGEVMKIIEEHVMKNQNVGKIGVEDIETRIVGDNEEKTL